MNGRTCMVNYIYGIGRRIDMKRIFIILCILLIGCVSGLSPNTIKYGNGGQIVVEDIAENWNFANEVCIGEITPYDCPNQTIHSHQRYYRNPKIDAEITTIILTIVKDTNEIVAVEFFENSVHYFFTKLCGSTSWKQWAPDPNKSA